MLELNESQTRGLLINPQLVEAHWRLTWMLFSPALDAEVRHNLFFAFKEALNNVVKHANATEVRVSLALETAAVTLAVEDNERGSVLENAGDGGMPLPAPQGGGNRLKNMKHRLAEVGGRCEIRSVPGEGTGVTFVLPVRPDTHGNR